MGYPNNQADQHYHKKNNVGAAFAFAISLNLIFAIVAASYALLTHSMSLLADAGHNLADVLGLLLFIEERIDIRLQFGHQGHDFG